ncbi:hypothetical protein BSN85_21750 [Bradyrhizobium brasilense]|nr:hypothetical protein BSN85_21750 [Bradyrhizobium brasilense]
MDFEARGGLFMSWPSLKAGLPGDHIFRGRGDRARSIVKTARSAADLTRERAQSMFVRAVFEGIYRLIPLEVGGAADLGLTQAAYPLQIAQHVSMAGG